MWIAVRQVREVAYHVLDRHRPLEPVHRHTCGVDSHHAGEIYLAPETAEDQPCDTRSVGYQQNVIRHVFPPDHAL